MTKKEYFKISDKIELNNLGKEFIDSTLELEDRIYTIEHIEKHKNGKLLIQVKERPNEFFDLMYFQSTSTQNFNNKLEEIMND